MLHSRSNPETGVKPSPDFRADVSNRSERTGIRRVLNSAQALKVPARKSGSQTQRRVPHCPFSVNPVRKSDITRPGGDVFAITDGKDGSIGCGAPALRTAGTKMSKLLHHLVCFATPPRPPSQRRGKQPKQRKQQLDRSGSRGQMREQRSKTDAPGETSSPCSRVIASDLVQRLARQSLLRSRNQPLTQQPRRLHRHTDAFSDHRVCLSDGVADAEHSF